MFIKATSMACSIALLSLSCILIAAAVALDHNAILEVTQRDFLMEPLPPTLIDDGSLQLFNLSDLWGHRLGDDKTQKACFVNAVGRGVGVPLHSCPSGTGQSGLLCYPNCKSGYSGVGPVCWQQCPSGLKDLGVFCFNTYGKGCCCTIFGCCGCPSGYTDDGCFCRRSLTKDSYGRGVGVPMICGPGEEQNGALCYPACQSGFTGVGPVCWGSGSTKFKVKCSDVLYADEQATCDQITAKIGTAGGVSAFCLGAAYIAGVSGGVFLPLAGAVCGASIKTAIDIVAKVVELTGARLC